MENLLGTAMLHISMAPAVLVSGAASATSSDVVSLSCRKWQGAHALPTLWIRQLVTCFEQEGFPTSS